MENTIKSWVKVQSFGGADTVTGSCHMITVTIGAYDYRYLVDCGTFQGKIGRKTPEVNFNISDIASKIDGVFITHAHIDHVGRVPALYKWGYSGKVYATEPVCELSKIMLEDSAKIQLEEYKKMIKKAANKKKSDIEGDVVELLYDEGNVREAVEHFVPVNQNEEIAINQIVTATFYEAGHALGSSHIKLVLNNGEETYTMLFSGDLGNYNNPILREANVPYFTDVDAVFVETTYAGRFHASQEENWYKIRKHIADTVNNGGRVIIPAFAVGRTQEILYLLFSDMVENNDEVANTLRKTSIYVDSMLAVAATRVFKEFQNELNDDVKRYMDHKKAGPFDFTNLHFVFEKEQSIELCESQEPCIILSAAGMCDAGRVIYHLRDNLDNPKSTIVFTGYQSEGTPGRRILDGAKTLNIAKKSCKVQASIYEINTLSAHADQNGIIRWLNNIQPGYTLFLTHGEADKQNIFKNLLCDFDTITNVECLKLDTEYYLMKNGFEKVAIEGGNPDQLIKVAKNIKTKDMKNLANLYESSQELRNLGGYERIVSSIKKEMRELKIGSRKKYFAETQIKRHKGKKSNKNA